MTDAERQKYTELIRGRMSAHRFEHSLNVAKEAVRLARLYGGDVEKAELAGLLHDVMKQSEPEEQLRYIRRKNRKITDVLQSSPKLWHSVAGAAYMEYALKIRDREVLDAVRYHTTARAGMSLLEKIIYIADYTSAERKYNGVEAMRKAADRDLNEAMRIALAFTIGNLAEKGSVIHPDTLKAYNEVILLGGNK